MSKPLFNCFSHVSTSSTRIGTPTVREHLDRTLDLFVSLLILSNMNWIAFAYYFR